MANIFLEFAEWNIPTSVGEGFCNPETANQCSNPGLASCYGWRREDVAAGDISVVDDVTHPKVWRGKATRLIFKSDEGSNSVRPLGGNFRPAINEFYMSAMVKFDSDHVSLEGFPKEYKVNRVLHNIPNSSTGLQFGGSAAFGGTGYSVDVDGVLQGAVFSEKVVEQRRDWPIEKWMVIENYCRINSAVGVADGICSGRVTVLDGESRDVIFDVTNSGIEWPANGGVPIEFVRFAWFFDNVTNGGVWPPGGVGGTTRTVFLANPFLSANPEDYDIRCEGGPALRPRAPTALA